MLWPNIWNWKQPLGLTHWGRVMHIFIGNITIIASDNGLSSGQRQPIIWINAIILLIGPPETNLSEILIVIHTFSLKKMHLKISFAKWRPFCPGLNVLITWFWKHSLMRKEIIELENQPTWNIKFCDNYYFLYAHRRKNACLIKRRGLSFIHF